MTLDKSTITAERICRCGHFERLHEADEKGIFVCTVTYCHHCKPKGSFTKTRGDDDYGFELSGYARQEPVVVEGERFGDKGSVSAHPAFGQIVANRVQGTGEYLYGSDFKHQHFITLQISESELHRELSGDRHHSHRRIIEVAMTEAQWATFVSSLNQGGGVPCTIGYEMHVGTLPGITAPVDRTTQFSVEMLERFAIAQTALVELAAQINTAPLSEKKKTELRRNLETAKMNIGNNTAFVTDRFDEHMERTVEKAKSEVNAYVENTQQRLASRAALEAGLVSNPLLLDAPVESDGEND